MYELKLIICYQKESLLHSIKVMLIMFMTKASRIETKKLNIKDIGIGTVHKIIKIGT